MASDLGERLRRERKRRRESQLQAAARFGMVQSSYGRWETGENRPAPEKYGAIAEYLGVRVEEIVSWVTSGIEPTSLSAVEERLSAMERDLGDMRAMVKETKREIERLQDTLTKLIAGLDGTDTAELKARGDASATGPVRRGAPRRPRKRR